MRVAKYPRLPCLQNIKKCYFFSSNFRGIVRITGRGSLPSLPFWDGWGPRTLPQVADRFARGPGQSRQTNLKNTFRVPCMRDLQASNNSIHDTGRPRAPCPGDHPESCRSPTMMAPVAAEPVGPLYRGVADVRSRTPRPWAAWLVLREACPCSCVRAFWKQCAHVPGSRIAPSYK